MPAMRFLLLIIMCTITTPLMAQAIKGEVLDMDTRHPIAGVRIENIYTNLDISSGEQGAFLIAATGGQLLEFKKQGYKTTRVRVPDGYIPSYFRIIMKKGISDIQGAVAQSNRYDYKSDSIRFYELYKHELDFPKLSAVGMVSHPFSAMSGKNREIWRFQETFSDFEKEKYVDKTFNEALVAKFTGLKGDSLRNYMRRYRPTYYQLRNMNDYTFFTFIKNSAHKFRSPETPRSSQ